MIKKAFICVILVLALTFSACTYSSGDPHKSIKRIEAVVTHNAVRTDEQLKVRYFTITENGKRSEVLPKDIETYFDDSDINNISVEKSNLFTFKSAGEYSVKLRLLNEMSIKGTLEVRSYAPEFCMQAAAKPLSEIQDIKMTENKATAAGKNAAEVYALLKENGATEINFTAILDTFKYYERDTYDSTLDLRYYVAVKVLKDGKTIQTNDGFKLFYLDEEKNTCTDIFGNVSDAHGFNGVEYSSIVGDLSGEIFIGTYPTTEIDSAYAADPARFIESNDYKFSIFCEEGGRYEIFVEAILKQGSKKFNLAPYLLEVAGDTDTHENQVKTTVKE